MIHPSASFGMWPSVQGVLDSTGLALRQLKKKIEPIVNSGRNRTVFKVHAKAWTLGLKIRAISTYRGWLVANYLTLKVGATIMRM
jgi:hypothetical protein